MAVPGHSRIFTDMCFAQDRKAAEKGFGGLRLKRGNYQTRGRGMLRREAIREL